MGAIPDSEDNVMMMIINDENEQSVILNNDVDGAEKRIEYEQFIPINNGLNNDEIVDMQTLALKAAQEFATLANENDNLFKENETLKARFDDILHDKTKLTEQLAKYQNNNSINSQIIDDIDSLKSEQLKWKMEKKLLMEQLEESNKQINGQLSDDRLMGKTAPKLKNDTSEDSNRLMMESLAKITREKNALLQTLENEKNMKREYEKMIANLNKSLTENERDRRLLSQNLNKQQALYQSLKQNAKKKEAEIDDIVGRTRTLTVEQEEQEKKQLLEAVDEQKAYIQQLEAENQQLMNAKIKDDDLMFSELKQLKTHRFARSQLDGTFDGIAGIASLSEHQRGPSHSMSNYSTSGLNIFNHLNAPLYPQSVRQINLSALDQEYSDEFEEDEMQQQQVYEATPSPKKSAKKVNFSEKDKDENKEKRKMEEMFKINAEIEFFLLTCIAVKANLVEEYQDKPEVMTEDAFKLYELVQKEHVSMNKFNIWIEMKLREKYDLPKLEGFQKFMEKYQIKDKVSAGITKTKKLAKETGDFISEKTQEMYTDT